MLDNAGNEIWLAQHNPDALGNAWWVREIAYADSDNDEMAALDTLNTALRAVANKSFASVLGQASADSTATVIETAYAPNRLAYKTSSKKDGIVVFSEIYFPWGWTATIDGKEAPIARANYVLRALRVPAGNHEIVFSFDPAELKVTDAVSVAAVILIYLLLCTSLTLVLWRRKKSTSKT